MAAPRVVILGGGFGGLAAATTLRQALGDRVDLLVVDAAPDFMMGLRQLWLLDGRATRAEGTRDRRTLPERAIPFRQGRVEAIDPERRRVAVDGDSLGYDYLIVALGAQPRSDLIPGGAAGGYNLYLPEEAEALGHRLRDLERGRILIAIAGLPYKCPPAPYEAAFIIEALLRRTGRRPAVELEVLTPQAMSLPVAGPAVCAQVEGTLAARRISFRTRAQVQRVEARRVLLADGSQVTADVVVYVPPHRPSQAITASGLADGEWIRPDPRTLATKAERVFALGDITEIPLAGGQALPKAGVFAERQGEVVARNLADLLAGREPVARFDGAGYCFIEVGDGKATTVDGRFFADPPDVRVADPTAESLAAKEAFERERLQRWFG
ncbi:MAG: FAD/NAD(P)-binding oxidoreductase [Armatimonadota bacterium]|nr:FAD/NAD(P)-binding oxidoreductase [Armatimonadota bacterium]MDR7539840.1 FAD/NAD(P)-binding oxidoreductase [Armatimonadota bacterium]